MEPIYSDGFIHWWGYSVEELHSQAPVRQTPMKHVILRGWVKTKRDSKAGLSFIHVTDGTHVRPYQVIAKSDLENYEDILKLTSGCSIEVAGEVVESKGKGQDYELVAEKIKIIGWVEDPQTYPMQPKDHSPEFLRSMAHLRPRSMVFGAVTRVRNQLAAATHKFFQSKGFYWIHTPIITGADCEGAGEMFRVSTLDLASIPKTESGEIDFSQDFFKGEAHLTVSGQLSVEPFACAMSKVYTFGPTFRAEKSNTSRHLSEFWMIEPEIAFADLKVDMYYATEYLRYMFREILDVCWEDLEFLDSKAEIPGLMDRLSIIASEEHEKMTYTEAIGILEKSGQDFDFPVKWGMDLQSEHEKFLCQHVGGKVLVLTDYPKDIKAFYMRLNDDEKTVAAMDILVPGVGEIVGGSQREERLDVLESRIVEMGLSPEDYGWYLDLRRYGTVPHAGFGLGFERAVRYATGVSNIRDTIPYPRAPGKIEF